MARRCRFIPISLRPRPRHPLTLIEGHGRYPSGKFGTVLSKKTQKRSATLCVSLCANGSWQCSGQGGGYTSITTSTTSNEYHQPVRGANTITTDCAKIADSDFLSISNVG